MHFIDSSCHIPSLYFPKLFLFLPFPFPLVGNDRCEAISQVLTEDMNGCGEAHLSGRELCKRGKETLSLSLVLWGHISAMGWDGMAPPTVSSSLHWVHFGWGTRTAQPSCAKLTPCISPCWCFAVPPRPRLYCDEQGSPVCEAAAGKPPAQLSWVPESSSTAEEKGHDNGTVTVLSRFTASSTSVTNMTNVTTCMVSHPAGNWSQSIAHCSPGKLPIVCSVFRALFSPLFMH